MSNELLQSQLDEAGDQIRDLKDRLRLQEKNLEERDKKMKDFQEALTSYLNIEALQDSRVLRLEGKVELLSKQVEELQAFISNMCIAKVDLRINGIIREVNLFVLNPQIQIVVQPQDVPTPPFTVVDSNGETTGKG